MRYTVARSGLWFCRVDGVEDLGRGEVMLTRAKDRFEHRSAGGSDTAALGSDLRQRVLELVAHARTVRPLRTIALGSQQA